VGVAEERRGVGRPPIGSAHEAKLLQRLHNAPNLNCECLPTCWCKRSRLGYAVQWYIPGPFHRLPRSASRIG
jgi:hypothetical protein